MSRFLRLALLLCFVLPVSLLTLGVDVWAANRFVQQARAAHRPSAMGTVTESTVATSRGSKGSTNYHFVVRYTYEVEGRRYAGSRVRYLMDNGTQDTVVGLARRFPQGSQVEVFYRPETPSEALLQPGLRGSDFLLLMLLGVFNFMVAALALLTLSKPATEVPSFEREGRPHVTLLSMPPVAVGSVTLGIGLMAGSLAWSTRAEPSVPQALLLWLAVFALGGAAMQAQRWRLDQGTRDLILDERTRTLSLPALLGRTQRLDVPWSQVVDVTVEPREIGGGKKVHGLVLELRIPPGMSRREVVCEWGPEDKALALADWLRSRLNPQANPRRTRASGT